MKIVFRTDASIQIGSGHVMRCLTLAEALRDRGAKVLFICRDLPGNLNAMIEAKGFDLCRLPAPGSHVAGLSWNRHANWLGVDWSQDAAETLRCLHEVDKSVDWLVVDHYALDRQWEVLMRPVAAKIMVIDDLADREHDCDLLLDQNLYPDQDTRYESLLSRNCKQLLGPGYALLRPEFSNLRRQLADRDGQVRRILVFMGGSDLDDVTSRVLDALKSLQEFMFEVDVVVGANSPNRKTVETLCREVPRCNFHCQVPNLAELMNKADLAIGGGGSAVWERACLGVPSLVLGIADNQSALAETVGERGCCLYLGMAAEVTTPEIVAAVLTLFKAPGLLQHFSTASRTLTDGRGVARVVRYLNGPTLRIREAVADDCEPVFNWRNAPEVRAHFFDPGPLCWDDHQRWFAGVLGDPMRCLLIGEADGQPVGVVRYDLAGQSSVVSVYLAPTQLGQGLGPSLLSAADQWLVQNRPEVRWVDAEILPRNVASREAFVAAGYELSYCIYRRRFA